MNSKLRKSLQYIAILGMFLPGILYSQDAKSMRFSACACGIQRVTGSQYTQFHLMDPCIPKDCEDYCTEFIKEEHDAKVTGVSCVFLPGKKGKTQSKTK